MHTTSWLGLSALILGACMSVPVERIGPVFDDAGDGDGDGKTDTDAGDGDMDGGPGDGDGDGDDAAADAAGDASPTCPERPCEATSPVCSNSQCVVCDQNHAGACEGTTKPLCKVNANVCVECNTDSDCKSPERSHCAEDNTCQPCDPAGNDECGHIPKARLCLEAGAAGRADNTCVECTGTNYADCGTAGDGTPYVCDSALHTCTQIKKQSVGLCAECITDAMCQSGTACVREAPKGQALGYVCQTIRTAAGPASVCKRPHIQPRNAVQSIDGVPTNVCGMRVTSCRAQGQFSNQVIGCESEQDDDACGLPDVADGMCKEFNSSFRCTVPCGSSDDCQDSFACNIEASPRFCDMQSGTCYNDGDCKAPTPKCNTATHRCGT